MLEHAKEDRRKYEGRLPLVDESTAENNRMSGVKANKLSRDVSLNSIDGTDRELVPGCVRFCRHENNRAWLCRLLGIPRDLLFFAPSLLDFSAATTLADYLRAS